MKIVGKILKWLGIGIGTLMVSIILASLVMNVIFSRELRQTLNEFKARGKPITIAEFAPPSVPDAENAALLLKEVAERIPARTNPAPSAMKSLTALIETNNSLGKVSTDIAGWTEAQRKEGALLIKSDEIKELYALLKKAAQRPRYNNNLDWSQGPAILLPNFGGYRMLFRMLTVKAGFEWQGGNPDQGLGTILIGLQVNNKLSDEPILVTQIVRMACDVMLIDELERLANASTIPAEQTQALITELSLHTNRKTWSKTMDGERVAMGIWCYDLLMRSKATESLSLFIFPAPKLPAATRWILNLTNLVLRPVIKKDCIVYLKLITELQRRFELPYYQIADVLKHQPIENQIPHYAFIARVSLPNLDKLCEKVAGHETQVKICRVGLALKLFKQKNGAYPDTLDKLAPEFLGTIPVDPFTGKALIYRKTDAGFILYSLGPDQQDDNGTPKPTGNKATGNEPYDIVWKCAW